MSEYDVPDLMGCPPERFWRVAQLAHKPIALVFAIAGGHTTDSYGYPLPVDRIRGIALLCALRAAA